MQRERATIEQATEEPVKTGIGEPEKISSSNKRNTINSLAIHPGRTTSFGSGKGAGECAYAVAPTGYLAADGGFVASNLLPINGYSNSGPGEMGRCGSPDHGVYFDRHTLHPGSRKPMPVSVLGRS